ncbi:hypothetical protein B0H17DRAFT_1294928 [Mycena rosella]|uniref:Uncharacterized protein n=1 Tax=Mycena rosella TaxID=1033263 RepID=A0AAD7DED3_MYCRO|nr:hypothetical protein B0H17DRAFT_1294928 [Mycena rosella]
MRNCSSLHPDFERNDERASMGFDPRNTSGSWSLRRLGRMRTLGYSVTGTSLASGVTNTNDSKRPSNPNKDDVIFWDVIIWTNGGLPIRILKAELMLWIGPGCSSGMGLFVELGTISTVFSPPKHLNIELRQRTTEDAAKDIAAFVAIFCAQFNKF